MALDYVGLAPNTCIFLLSSLMHCEPSQLRTIFTSTHYIQESTSAAVTTIYSDLILAWRNPQGKKTEEQIEENKPQYHSTKQHLLTTESTRCSSFLLKLQWSTIAAPTPSVISQVLLKHQVHLSGGWKHSDHIAYPEPFPGVSTWSYQPHSPPPFNLS